MADVKLTKNELRAQQRRLVQLEKYLPTLQLKKAMLQMEVQNARHEIEQLAARQQQLFSTVESFGELLSDGVAVDWTKAAVVASINRRYENIAGVDVPYFEGVLFEPYEYGLVDTPPWVDDVMTELRSLASSKAHVLVAREKKEALEHELRQVSIRVNLFEKILIPRAQKNIRRIRVFLGDLQLSAVAQAKVAKGKIEERRRQHQSRSHHA